MRDEPKVALALKPSINIIGAGRLGTALAIAFVSRGYAINALVARHTRHAQRAAKLVRAESETRPLTQNDAPPLALNDRQLHKLPHSDIIIITTPDDAIADTAQRLAALSQSRAASHKPRTAFHASGALSSSALSALHDVGFRTGSMHPLIAVSDSAQGALSLRTAFFCLEGERTAVRVARTLVRDLGAQSFAIHQRDKALYHAAAVMASGHMVALFDMASEMLQRCGLNERRARAVLLPLVRSTLENLAQREPARTLTGTFARADISTVRHHLNALQALGSNEILAAYSLLGQRSLQLAQKNGVDEDTIKKIKRILEVE
jgi:predicted short-subunit dehydrogenase-like oxidoreductase (DUF2520 family)